MKKQILILFLILCLFPIGLYSKEHDVVYLDGYPYLRTEDGDEIDLDIGDRVRVKQTIITGEDERVELESDGYKVVISENTVFSLLEMEIKGKKTNVLSCALGKLSFTKKKFMGTEPRLMTSSVVCGVRGTEVTLMAGVDGSSMIIVDDGLVEVLAGGKSLALGKNEGVEVETGAAPGEKFEVLKGYIDYGEWNQGKLDSMMNNPVKTAINIHVKLNEYVTEINKLLPVLEERHKLLKSEEEKAKEILKMKGIEERDKYFKANVSPLRAEVTYLFLNIRHYALSSLSLRRFVLGRMYMILKGRYINDLIDPTYQGFLKVKADILETFEREVVPHIVIQDI